MLELHQLAGERGALLPQRYAAYATNDMVVAEPKLDARLHMAHDEAAQHRLQRHRPRARLPPGRLDAWLLSLAEGGVGERGVLLNYIIERVQRRHQTELQAMLDLAAEDEADWTNYSI
jgi:hypothetical protein